MDGTQIRAVLEVVKGGTLSTQATKEVYKVIARQDRSAEYNTAARTAVLPSRSEGGG